MEPRKRHRKGQIAPESRATEKGEDNDGFAMDEMKDTATSKLRGSLKFQEIASNMIPHKQVNPFDLLANVKKRAEEWRHYTNTRRVRKRPISALAVSAAKLSDNNADIKGHLTDGLGLDSVSDSRKNNIVINEMAKVSSRNLLEYFAERGHSQEENETINLQFVHQLVDSGADINVADKHGQTLLYEVARCWHIDVARFLIELGADVNKGDNWGRTPLHVAAAVDYPEMVNLLIDRGAEKEAKTKGELQTPVFYAARTDAVQSLKVLVKHGCKYKNELDYKGRTPIHVAAELDRSETARLLLEMDAPSFIADNQGVRAITWMINKMTPVANEALGQFHMTDRPNRKQCFFLNYLVNDKDKDPEGKALTPLQVAVADGKHDLIMHPVFKRLTDIMWIKFARFWALYQLGVNFAYIAIWTVVGIVVEYDKRYIYNLPDDGWRIFLFILATLVTVYQIYEEIMEFRRSQILQNEYKKRRLEDIKRDMKFCHPRWPEEETYLKAEIQIVNDKTSNYFSDMWNIFDWVCYVFLLVCIMTHIWDVIAHSELIARAHIRLMAIAIILLWLRLMKNLRAFALLGPFIVMLGHMIKDCVRFIFLYLEFYIPYLAAFWMIFGGTKKKASDSSQEITVNGYTYPGQLFFSMFRLTLVDEYDYESMTQIDNVMADILLTTWFFLSAILCLNLFIALLSDTFQRVYDNAQANSVMQKAITILNIWDGVNERTKKKFLDYVAAECSPKFDEYDDDMNQAGDEDVKKVTIQIKEELDNFQELFKLHFGDPTSPSLSTGTTLTGGGGGGSGKSSVLVTSERFSSEVKLLKESLEAVRADQEKLSSSLRKDMKSVKSMLRQLLGMQVLPESPPSYASNEQTPVTRMRKKKKSASPGLDIDTVEQGSSSSIVDGQGLFDLPEFSPGSFTDLTRTAPPQAFDMMLSPSSTSRQQQQQQQQQPPPTGPDNGDSTTC